MLIKNAKKKFRRWLCGVTFGFLKKFLDPELRELLGDAILQFSETMARQTAIRATMASLEKHGLAHCAVCSARFGLRRIDDKWACKNHHEAVERLKKEPAAA